ncbi:MAG TPA: hypothetical protein DEA96_06310 [Leptospiraceae bacterium]|nr:hypothetical protein [Spirochaetaceae bacterium]HBS04557.1 hypothetical protein [Leptospiraceae bacterium]|tara:strand:- start:30615 stop:31508 length:894 start_codon:yes stop_codon:yes gene_type:complete
MTTRRNSATESGLNLIIRLALILALGLASANCSGFVFKTFYRNLDTLIQSRMDSYLAMTDDQEEYIDSRIEHHYRWHRYGELPRYAVVSQDLATRIERGLQKSDLEYIYGQMRQSRIRLAQRIYPDASRFLKGFDSSLIGRQQELISEYNKELAEEVSRPASERFQDRLESNLEFFEFFLGNLSDSQRKRIQRYTTQSTDTAGLYLAYRRMNQTRLMSLLKKGAGGHDELDTFLKQYLFSWESLYPATYRNAVYRNRSLFYDTVLDLDSSMTAEQRKHAASQVRELATNFLELAGKK